MRSAIVSRGRVLKSANPLSMDPIMSALDAIKAGLALFKEDLSMIVFDIDKLQQWVHKTAPPNDERRH